MWATEGPSVLGLKISLLFQGSSTSAVGASRKRETEEIGLTPLSTGPSWLHCEQRPLLAIADRASAAQTSNQAPCH